MGQEDIQLLLKDLCARLPYGVMMQIPELFYPQRMVIEKLVAIDELHINDSGIYIEFVKPYLRSMSSMTEEEAKDISILYGLKDILSIKITDEYIEVVVDDGVCSTETRTIWYDEIISSIEIFDWLNAHHFDFRGLIERGLAIEVTEENNPYKE